jgi:hypothetical protein
VLGKVVGHGKITWRIIQKSLQSSVQALISQSVKSMNFIATQGALFFEDINFKVS